MMSVNSSNVLFGVSTLVIGLLSAAILVCGYTWISTSIFFRLDIKSLLERTKKDEASVPPLIPHIVPGLGSTITFSNQTIGEFWENLKVLSRKHGGLTAFSIILSGTRTHFIFSPQGIASAFKARQLARDKLDQQLGTNGINGTLDDRSLIALQSVNILSAVLIHHFICADTVLALGMSKADAAKAFGPEDDFKEKQSTARIHSENLLSSSAVNALTTKFMECFHTELAADKALNNGVEIELYAWLWQKIFRSSTTALCGSELLKMYPDFDVDYRVWEDNMLAMLFGTPRLFARSAFAARDATVAKLEEWLEHGYANSSPNDDPDWEPYFGARVVRKRHGFYQQQGMSIKGQAGDDLIFLAGILSNATPSTGWLLMHILSPTSKGDFKQRILRELRSAQRKDGSIDVPALTKLPLLNSAFHETLRLYVDLLVVRQADQDVALDKHYVRRGEMVMAPTWMTHRNPDFFERPEEFDPERFLQQDPRSGELTYSISGLNGRYFPFGGGHYMCPGRTFAKQEVLGSVAVLLLNFDIEFIKFVRPKGSKPKATDTKSAGFPTLKNNYAGNQVIGIAGDIKVRIKRRTIAV